MAYTRSFAVIHVLPNGAVAGSGAQSIRLSGDATTGTMTFDFAGSLAIPSCGTTTGSALSRLDLTAIEPC